jgi:cystathionine beta-lyase
MPITYDFDAPPNRLNTDSIKWSQYDPDVLPMWVADMDFRSPEPVIQALHQRVEHGIFGYPDGIGNQPDDKMEMRLAIVERLERLYRWRVQPEEIVFVPGVVTGFNRACHLVAEPGAAVLVQPPVYYPILHAPATAELERQDAPLTPVNKNGVLRYEIDMQAFEAAISPATRLFILCNPHNPVGRVFSRSELEQMAQICLRHNVLICSDEIHCDLVFNGYQHLPLAALDSEIARRTITLMAPSKTFNIPGLEFSFAVIQDDELRKAYMRTTKGLVGWINIMGWVAALAAYREGQEWLEQLMLYLQSNRDHIFEFVRREMPQISLTQPPT